MQRNQRRRRLLFIALFVLLIIPFFISLMYGNSPFKYQINNGNGQTGILYSDPNYSFPNSNGKSQGIINNTLPPHNYSSLEAKYYASRTMTFSHIFRDTIVLMLIALLSMILERKFRILDTIFRR